MTMFELNQEFESNCSSMVFSDIGNNNPCDLFNGGFDLSLVKTEPNDWSLFDESYLCKPVYHTAHTTSRIKSEDLLFSDYGTESENSFLEQTSLDLQYSSGKDKRATRTPKSLRLSTEMTEVLRRPDSSTPVRKRGEGKRTGRGSSTPYTTVPLPPCKVCGGVATGFHFGVITCEACKAFFRRALIHKQAYKCLKDDNCEIVDKKLGNCSACRLKKCFALGMSKGGVRRGRYSIAIRTKAIVEAKALEGREAEAMVTNNKRVKLSPPHDGFSHQSPTLSSDSGYGDEFDGLLEISDLDEDLNMTVTVINKPTAVPAPVPAPVPAVARNSEMEYLIDAVISCQDAVYPKLKKQFENYHENMQVKVFEELVIKEELFGEVFGKTDVLSTEEFQTVFAETGLDLDDRLLQFNKKGKSMEESIAQYVNFAKIIPGFKSLNPKDVSKLLKAGHLEFWVFGHYKLFNKQLGICTAWDGNDGSTKETMAKFFDVEWIEKTLDFAESLKKLNLTIVELALIRVIILTYTDRCSIMEREKVQALQEKFVECLQYHLERTVPNPGQKLAQIFDRLLAIRDITELNTKVNRKFLNEWGFLMHDYPLWKEMLSFDEI